MSDDGHHHPPSTSILRGVRGSTPPSSSAPSNSATTNSLLNKLGLFLIFLCVYSIAMNHILLLEERTSDAVIAGAAIVAETGALDRKVSSASSFVSITQQSSSTGKAPKQQRQNSPGMYTCSYGNTTVTVPTETPTFIMIGVQKSGTTALLTYFRDHPQILETKKKFTREAHFFDTSWNGLMKKAKAMGLKQANEKNCYILETYMKLFQTERVLEQRIATSSNNNNTGGPSSSSSTTTLSPPLFTFEKTPSYFANPMIAKRMQQIVPWSKVILILRNPIDRLYSQYKMTIKDVFDLRKYSLEDMVHHELHAMKYHYHMTTAPLLLGEEETLAEYRGDDGKPRSSSSGTAISTAAAPPVVPYDHTITPDQWTPPHKSLGKYSDNGPLGHHILVRRGLYAIQLQWWLEQFSLNENLLVINYADMKADTQEVYERILQFSGIPIVADQNQEQVVLEKVRADERKDYRPLSNSTRQYLQQFYAPYNVQLEALLGPEWAADRLGW